MRYLLPFLMDSIFFASSDSGASGRYNQSSLYYEYHDGLGKYVATDQMEVIPLLKVGIDPHVYKPKKGFRPLREADVIIPASFRREDYRSAGAHGG